jgi:hypothetical protein
MNIKNFFPVTQVENLGNARLLWKIPRVIVSFKLKSWNIPGGAEKNHKISNL